jgi:2-polyprenyl-3-methyl-5-hydroxy-6-metoxy-1,4-benzoquinol methylase
VPSEIQARDAYDLWHQALCTDADADTPWYRMLKPYLLAEDVTDKRVLEIGCGRGDLSCWLAKNTKAAITAADFSYTAVAMGSKFAAGLGVKIDWRVMDIQSIACPNATFDFVISSETIEHVPDPALAVRELARVIKPGGKLFLTVPNYLNPTGMYRGYLRLKGTPYTEAGQPINRFVTLPRTLGWLRAARLRVLQSDSRGMYLPIPGKRWTECNWLRPRFLTRWLGLHSMVIAQK